MSIEAVDESLLLLKDLVTTNIGKGILAQPSCISNLFAFILDDDLSPHITQTVIQLLQIALPSICHEDLTEVNLSVMETPYPESKILAILIKKLGSLLAPLSIDQFQFKLTLIKKAVKEGPQF